MYKIRLNIDSEFYYDDEVFIEIELPVIPEIGDIISITQEQRLQLEETAKKTLKIAKRYINWFYYASSRITDVKEENLKDLDFEDAVSVCRRVFIPNSEIIYVVLSHNFPEH